MPVVWSECSVNRMDAIKRGPESMNMIAQDSIRYTKIPLAHGSGALPAVGFGTLIPDSLVTRQAVKTALEEGFRHFDCAERYRNEEAIGDAMQEVFKAGAIKREDVVITTKLWNTNPRPERVKPAFDGSRRRLQSEYVDCYVIHTPFAFRPGDEQDPRDEHGQEEIVAGSRIKPAVIQVESHPYLPEWDLVDYCREHGIAVQAFAPLGHAMEPRVVDDPVITAIAKRIKKTPAQVALAWAVQRGTAFLTTSTTRPHIQENFEISILPEDAMREIRDDIKTNVRFNSVVRTGVPGFIPRSR
jgi:diketogulonate reductase-like aldo/keto reductase